MDSPDAVVLTQDLPFLGVVQAGFPSPASDYLDQSLDLTRRFIHRPQASYIMRIAGDSLLGAGIVPGDYVVVDRSLTPRDRHIVIAIVNGELTAKRYLQQGNMIVLAAENPAYPAVPWGEGCEIWGVVTSVHRDVLATH